MTDILDPWKILGKPFPFEEIEIKPQTVSRDNTKALAVAYFDARAAQARLDEAFGPAGWDFEVREIGKGIIGRLTVFIGDSPTIREDGSEYTDIEALKGAISGAFKRCFSALGNRTLYEVDLGWQPIKTYNAGGKEKFDSWTPEAMSAMKAKYERQLGVTKTAARTIPDDAGIPLRFDREALPGEHQEAIDYMKKVCELTASEFAALKNATPRGSDYRLVLLAAKSKGIKDLVGIIRLVDPNFKQEAA